MKKYGLLFLLALSLSVVQCASDAAKNLEDAKFALDEEDFSAAISAADAVLNEEPNNVPAARILASAYMGRGGFNMHDIAVKLLDLEDESDSNYTVLAPVLPEDGDLEDMQLAITTLSGLDDLDFASLTADGLATDDLKDAAYDLGLMQMVYHYAIAIYHTGYKDDPLTYNVDDLTDDDSTFDDLEEAQTALVQFDNYLIAAGFDPNDDTGGFITEVRKTHCLMQGVSADEGYSLETYQATVLCNLSEASEDEDPAAIDPDFVDCSLSNPDDPGISADVIACFDEDTVLE